MTSKVNRKHKKPGRKTDYRPEYCAKLIAFMAKGRSYEAFGAEVKASKQTLYDWEKRFPAFLDAKKEGWAARHRTLEEWGEKLIKGQYRGSTGAWVFMMKNMTGYRDDPMIEEEEIEGFKYNDE